VDPSSFFLLTLERDRQPVETRIIQFREKPGIYSWQIRGRRREEAFGTGWD